MELLIIIVVATIGTAVVVGWMNNVESQTPDTYGDISSDITMVSTDGTYYSVNGEAICADKDFSMKIHVTNGKGDGIRNAVVTLSGLGISGEKTFGQTDTNGDIAFSKLTLKTHSAGNIGYIIVSISSDIGSSELKIPVVMQ